MTEGARFATIWDNTPAKGTRYRNYAEQENLNYWPGGHNVALLHLFGFWQVTTGKPGKGKGWRVKQVKRLPLGDAVVELFRRATIANHYIWESKSDVTVPYGEMQSTFQPYFPEWQNCFALLQPDTREGVYTFKVSLGSIWRRIAISSDRSLEDLAYAIRKSVDFDSDHLDMFEFADALGRQREITHPWSDSGDLSTSDVRIGEVPLQVGQVMTYIFDFGDWWKFEVCLESVDENASKHRYLKELDRHGEAPPQYPNWDYD
ncbi:hypothetical protein [Synechococcus sp. PCC 7336]|uniref:IS1096 element passenger TnpR family protein n=1 Tax=Synechococcus sp. PCC 7336 TaxID=195250 RepID=UPI000347E986|nr:hypothetical protein [Synechococcus sp. PCC 7336]